jgi:hypothetical protein
MQYVFDAASANSIRILLSPCESRSIQCQMRSLKSSPPLHWTLFYCAQIVEVINEHKENRLRFYYGACIIQEKLG